MEKRDELKHAAPGPDTGEKHVYEAPTLTKFGNIVEVTRGVHLGNQPDNTMVSA